MSFRIISNQEGQQRRFFGVNKVVSLGLGIRQSERNRQATKTGFRSIIFGLGLGLEALRDWCSLVCAYQSERDITLRNRDLPEWPGAPQAKARLTDLGFTDRAVDDMVKRKSMVKVARRLRLEANSFPYWGLWCSVQRLGKSLVQSGNKPSIQSL